MKKLFIYPDVYSDSNYYLNNLSNILKDEYELYGMKKEKKNGIKNLLNGDIFHFNWYESIDSNSYIKTLITYYKRKIFIQILKINGKKIVWTVHNNQPHDSKYLKLNLKMMKILAKNADRIHILCSYTATNKVLEKYQDKIVLIHHGDYIGNYKNCNINIRKKYNIDNNKKILLFIGQIRQYKNIELLINSFVNSNLYKENFVLLICGKCNDISYKDFLLNNSNENIIFDFNFIKNEEMSAYLDASDLLIAPYDKDSSLNSGTLWMAMSYKKSMILPLIGCVRDIENYNELLFVYDYNNKQEHLNNLKNCLNSVENKNLSNMGLKCYNYMVDKQSWIKNKEKWINLFRFR